LKPPHGCYEGWPASPRLSGCTFPRAQAPRFTASERRQRQAERQRARRKKSSKACEPDAGGIVGIATEVQDPSSSTTNKSSSVHTPDLSPPPSVRANTLNLNTSLTRMYVTLQLTVKVSLL